ncbi:MAG TPA: protein phosphatase CheZ [Burkholderiaceae bacterium]
MSSQASAAVAEPSQLDPSQHDEFLMRVGQMTRTLHDSLRGLGLDKLIERAAADIPDARDRLDYVARMSEQAAQRVLNATDAAGPLQEQIDSNADTAATAMRAALDNGDPAQMRAAMEQSLALLAQTNECTSQTKSHLMDIMMAQDFQDLTGQVIKRVTELAHNLEQQLVQMLIDFAPPDIKREVSNGLLNGPQINPTGNADVVANQGQVDDLLDSLGF